MYKGVYKIKEQRNDNTEKLTDCLTENGIGNQTKYPVWNDGSNSTEQQYAHWLYTVPGIGRVTMLQLLLRFGSAEEVYTASERKLRLLLRGNLTYVLLQDKQKRNIQKEYELLRQQGITVYPFTHPAYPHRLRALPDAPALLYCIGSLPPETRPSVALIGARDCSPYGSFMAEQIGAVMARAGVSVISGMARGVDGIAQRAAMQAGGMTYGVLGCGVSVCYPEENRTIYEAMKRQGGILSEYRPDTQPKAQLFPPRNRIISGLAEAVIVIEAKEKSGTCITVDMALEQGKEVYAVPGRIGDGLSSGCNQLIAQGAGIVTNPEHLPEQLFGQLAEKVKEQSGSAESVASGRAAGMQCDSRGSTAHASDAKPSSRQQRILAALGTTPTRIETVCALLEADTAQGALSLSDIRTELLAMTVKGYVKAVGGSYFQRNFDSI